MNNWRQEYEDAITERNKLIMELTKERQISDDVVKDLEIARTYNLELQEKLERRACHVVKLKEALQDLMDEQNGPPLIRNQASWEAAMTKAKEALEG